MTFDVAQALLAAPGSGRRKKKYVLHLIRGAHVNPSDVRAVVRAVALGMPDHTHLKLEDPDEALKVLLIKNIEFIILDCSFFGDDLLSVEYALEIKKHKKVPVYFITRNEGRLIREYRERMALYEEMDDYSSSPIDLVELTRKLRRASTLDSRAAKRFSVDEKVLVRRLVSDTFEEARLVDLSLVGFGVQIETLPLLTRGEQVRIHLPLPAFSLFHPQYGELLKLAGRVRRVAIDGRRVGCSLEHATPLQLDCLTRLLEQIARGQRVQKIQTLPKEAS